MTEVPHDIVVEGIVLPAAEGTCPKCAVDHPADWPHNQQSLYYQYAWYHDNMSWPNWGDAMAHCTQQMKEAWREKLREIGVDEDKLWAAGELPPGDPT